MHASTDGRLVIVFAHKHPDAWETLVSAIIRAGFVVDGSWPIQTEMGNRTRSAHPPRLASSVWLVCKKRPDDCPAGLGQQGARRDAGNIGERLREFWDAGIRGPDFVWAATGPALEAYSKHPVVKMANEPGQTHGGRRVPNHVRRMVVDFVVGRVLLAMNGDADSPPRIGWTSRRPTTCFIATTSAWTMRPSGPASSTPPRAACRTRIWSHVGPPCQDRRRRRGRRR